MNEVCKWCRGKVSGFRDKLSEKEFRISGLCQKCQDETFSKKRYKGLSKDNLDELKQIYLKHYGTMLTDQEALDLGIKLVETFKVIARPIPTVKKEKEEVNNNGSTR